MSFNILIADDEALIRTDLRELLTGLGYKVVAEASDGKEALELAERQRPDLMILDIRMPGMDGIEVARILAKNLPIIMLTAHSSPDLIHAARDAGVMSYLTKPFREQDIGPAIELAVTHFMRESQLTEKVETLKEQLETRRLLDRAKALLTEKENLPESKAFRHIQKLSMDKNIPLRKVAELIIEVYSKK
tara:strand:+ start:160638 stop:161207 length:570 start_codon:yes stop_codon:yes gene_type:complete